MLGRASPGSRRPLESGAKSRSRRFITAPMTWRPGPKRGLMEYSQENFWPEESRAEARRFWAERPLPRAASRALWAWARSGPSKRPARLNTAPGSRSSPRSWRAAWLPPMKRWAPSRATTASPAVRARLLSAELMPSPRVSLVSLHYREHYASQPTRGQPANFMGAGRPNKTTHHCGAAQNGGLLDRFRCPLPPGMASRRQTRRLASEGRRRSHSYAEARAQPATPYAGGWRSRTRRPHKICGLKLDAQDLLHLLVLQKGRDVPANGPELLVGQPGVQEAPGVAVSLTARHLDDLLQRALTG